MFLMAPFAHAQKKSKWTPLFGRENKKVEVNKIEKKKEYVSPNQKTPYEEYYLMIRGKIYDMIEQENDLDIKGEVEVQFTLDKRGIITRGPIVLDKPDLRLVRAAVKCVKKVAPFPPFPSNLNREEIEVYILMKYE